MVSRFFGVALSKVCIIRYAKNISKADALTTMYDKVRCYRAYVTFRNEERAIWNDSCSYDITPLLKLSRNFYIYILRFISNITNTIMIVESHSSTDTILKCFA